MGALGDELGFDLNTPWEDLTPKAQQSLLDGPPDQGPRRHHATATAAQRAYYAEFEGVRPYIERRHREAESDTSRERFEGFMREVPCPACSGSRLKPVSMAVTLGARDDGGKNIAEVCALPINETADYLRNLDLTARERQIGERVLKEIQERLQLPARRRPRLPLARPALAARCPAARRSGSGWRPRSAPAWSASSTSSTSRRSGSTSATTTG